MIIEYDISPLIKIPETELWMKFDLFKKQPVSVVPNENFDDHHLYFHPKGNYMVIRRIVSSLCWWFDVGGILADEMGLGKTLEGENSFDFGVNPLITNNISYRLNYRQSCACRVADGSPTIFVTFNAQ